MHLELDVLASQDCADLTLEIYLDQTKIFESTATQQIQTVACDIDESPGDHVLKLVMNGKSDKHTVVDQDGQIISDVYFEIGRLEFEGLDMKEIFCLGHECYTHNFNSTQELFLDEFYGILGCNGTVEFKFSTPIFLWLNDHFD